MVASLPTGQTTIQGHIAASKEEVWVAQSLGALGWTYEFQVPFFGGRNISGGFVVDFIVDTIPKQTPLWVNGNYWHSGAQAEKDRANQVLLASRLKTFFPAVTLWGEDMPDPETTMQAVLKLFGRL